MYVALYNGILLIFKLNTKLLWIVFRSLVSLTNKMKTTGKSCYKDYITHASVSVLLAMSMLGVCVCVYIFNFIHLQNRHRQTNCCQLHLNSCVLLVLPMCLYGVSSTSDNVATQPLSMWMCTPSVYIYILMPFLRIQFVTK